MPLSKAVHDALGSRATWQEADPNLRVSFCAFMRPYHMSPFQVRDAWFAFRAGWLAKEKE